MYVCLFVCLFVRSGKLGVRIGAGSDLLRMELFCSNVEPEYPESVTKALYMCFETAVNSEDFINKSRNTVAIVHS